MANKRTTLKAADLQRIGVSKPYAHQLVSGLRSPSLRLALRIEAELGVSPTVWPMPRPANDAKAQERAA